MGGEETPCPTVSGIVGEEVLFMTVQKALSKGGYECLQWNRDSRSSCGMNLGYKSRAVGTEAINYLEIVKKA